MLIKVSKQPQIVSKLRWTCPKCEVGEMIHNKGSKVTAAKYHSCNNCDYTKSIDYHEFPHLFYEAAPNREVEIRTKKV